MYKKITAMCLAFVMLFSLAAAPVYAHEYESISVKQLTTVATKDKKDKDKDYYDYDDVIRKFIDSHELIWAQKSIEKMGFLGILNGIGNGYFKPQNNVTHAEAIAMVLKLTGYKEKAEAIKKEPAYFRGYCDPWSYGYLQLALDMGIIIPEEDGKFNPKAPAKRHEVAKYVVRALGKRDVALKNMKAKLHYKDASAVPKGSVGYVYVITDLGIMQGSNNQFQPNKPITRAELAVILDKAESIINQPQENDSTVQGEFISFDRNKEKITLKVNNKIVVYDVNPIAPVYKDSRYYRITSLNPGDVIRIIMDNEKKVIFIELISQTEKPQEPTEEELSFTNMQYSSLPEAIKAKVDSLKTSANYAAFKYGDDIYLIAARGKMPTGGYTIKIEEVYKEVVAKDQYNLKVVVDMENPGSSFVTQAITYPYSVVKLDYFDDIEKVTFVNTSNRQLAQTTIKEINEVSVIEGKISSISSSSRKISLVDKNGKTKSYTIPTDAHIILDGKLARFTDLAKNMSVIITIVDGKVTQVVAESPVIIETITGKIYSVDVKARVINLVDDKGKRTSYSIPANVTITLDGKAASLSALKKDMTVEITRVNGEITKLAAQSPAQVVETIEGKIDDIDSAQRIVKIIEKNNKVNSYHIPTSVKITLNGRNSSLSALMEGMTVVLTRTNGVITKLEANSLVETIEGKIDSVDTVSRVIRVLENDNYIRSYYIPSNVVITLNGKASSLSALSKDMTVVITRTNGVITKLAATNIVETISGKIDSVDTAGKVVKLLEKGNVIKAYTIPEDAEITLNDEIAELADLIKGMTAVITIVNGEITKLAAQNDLQTLEGILVTTYTNQNKTYISVKVGQSINAYEVTSNTAVFYNGQSADIEDIPFNSTVVLKFENGELKEVRNK